MSGDRRSVTCRQCGRAMLPGRGRRRVYCSAACKQAAYRARQAALVNGGRLMSAYEIGTATIWVITEAGRGATVITLPDNY